MQERLLSELAAAVEGGAEDQARTLLRRALAEGLAPRVILNEGLVAGLQALGERFARGDVFLPEVLIAGEAFTQVSAMLEPVLLDEGSAHLGRVVIGTVAGDLHDIGKNLVAMLLRGHGFEVVDLGVDVSAERFAETAAAHDADIVALSSLLSTTTAEFTATVGALSGAGLRSRVRVMIGGAPVTPRLVAATGADGFAEDCVAAVTEAIRLTSVHREINRVVHAGPAADEAPATATPEPAVLELPLARPGRMTPRERVLAALARQVPDRVPIVEVFDWEPMTRLAAAAGVEIPDPAAPFAYETLACTLAPAIGIDAPMMVMYAGFTRVDDHHVRDRYGTVYRESPHGEPVPVEGPIASAADLAGFHMASRITPADFAALRHARAILGPDRPLIMYFHDTFKLSWQLRGGMQNLLVDFAKDPGLVHALARLATDATVATIQGAAEAGVDVLMMEGDLASEQAPFFSLEHFRAYIRPYYEEIVAAARGVGLPIFKHSDGNMWPFMQDLADMGFDGYNPIQPQCMDIAEVKRKHGADLCLIGNIDCRDLLCFSPPEEVEAVVEATLKVAAPGGAFILCSSNSIHPGVRTENYLAMVRAGLAHGGY